MLRFMSQNSPDLSHIAKARPLLSQDEKKQLSEHLKQNGLLVENWLDKKLASLEANTKSQLLSAMRYSLLNGGKRVRASLILETARLFEIKDDITLPLAAAIECMHAYSLIHDDLPAMDDDDIRRGKPTNHIAFDEATAILAGDGLQSLAFEIIAEHAALPDHNKVKIIQKLAYSSGISGMCEGQMLDMEGYHDNEKNLESIHHIQSLKTGALFSFCLYAGGVLGNANKDQHIDLQLYADKIGFLFQVQDDILDHTSTADILGKTAGKDAEQNKQTAISVLGLAEAQILASQLYSDAIQACEKLPNEGDMLSHIAQYILCRDH